MYIHVPGIPSNILILSFMERILTTVGTRDLNSTLLKMRHCQTACTDQLYSYINIALKR